MKKNVLLLAVSAVTAALTAACGGLSTASYPQEREGSLYSSSSEKNTGADTMDMTVNGRTFSISLEQNETASAFKEMLPLTLEMSELNGNEKYYYLDRDLPVLEDSGHITAGDVMLYGSRCIVVFYKSFDTPYSYTKIGHIADYSALQDALGSGSVSVTFSPDAGNETAYSVQDVCCLQDYILTRQNDNDISGKDYDLDSDGAWTVFDLCMMKTNAASQLEERSIIVSDINSLSAALKNASPGDIIKVAPGVYDCSAKTLKSENDGTSSAPITLTALDKNDPPVLKGASTEHGYVLHILGDWWDIDSIICTGCQKGIVLDNSNNTVIRNCELHTLGAEAVAIRDGSLYCTVDSCYIHDTGLVSPGYGEGVYVGSAKSTTGYDHKCDHSRILRCTFRNVAAEHVDVKEYTTDTEIAFCTFYGDGMTGANYAGSFIDLKGNDCYVHDNTGYRNGNPKIIAAFEIHEQVEGWGYHHIFENNTVYMDQPYGAEDTSRRMYVVDGWFSDFTVKNNLADLGNGLVPADSWEFYNSDHVTYE